MRFLVLIILLLAQVAHATPPEPAGPHPRMLLDRELRAAWRAQAKLPAGPVIGAIRLCTDARTTRNHTRALYQGSEWARVLQACLVAWAATEDKHHAATAITYFTALIDDRDTLGDHRGGDEAARRDHGYAIRFLGPYTALAYDWLYPLLTEELKARARQRWRAWLAWYREHGYRPRTPGSNYHAGYLLAATTIAIAQAGEAGSESSERWREVADELWAHDMAAALTNDGVLAGGNWPEGWQYGPLATAEYALAARLMRGAGVANPAIGPWLSSVLRHHVYSLTPSETVYAGGDTEHESAYIAPHVLTLNAIAFGDASADDKRWARGELSRLRLHDRDWFLYDALAAVGDKPTPPPRSAWPTWYLAQNTGTLYARTRWDERAIWFAAECQAAIDTDHRHPNAGTFALSRGRDNVIVDPSPYGSQSSLTSNAPTVVSAQLPPHYQPSQALWGERTGYEFATQRASGIVAARCDYADQYKFQQRRSDVPSAVRDFVLVPSVDGSDAALVVIDRAETAEEARAMWLRFRTPGQLELAGETATATVGGTQLAIASVARSSGNAAIGVPSAKHCYEPGTRRGRCDAARFPVTDYRVQIAGPRPTAVHLISATAANAPPATATPLSGDSWSGVRVTGVRDAVIVWRIGEGALDYAAPAGATVTHVVLDARGPLTARRDGDQCRVSSAGTGAAQAMVATLDAQCNVTVDPEAAAASAIGTRPRRLPARSVRSGCCGAEAAPGSSFATAFSVLVLLLWRRRATCRSART